MQTYLHHVVAITGAVGGAVIQGVFGSLSQLTWFTEGSTFFVNLRWLLATHHLTDNIVYIVNGLMMTLSFFFYRIVLYTYMIFWVIYPVTIDQVNYVKEYPTKAEQYFGYFLIIAYIIMGSLQVFWFNKILQGLLKALGIIKKPVKSNKKE